MKTVCMHFRLFLCFLSAAVLLGVITLTPCAWGEKGSLLGRRYGWDSGRFCELSDRVKQVVRRCAEKK